MERLAAVSRRTVPVAMVAFSLAMNVSQATPAPTRTTPARLAERARGLTLPFIRNDGQADPAVAYYAPTFAGTVYVTRGGEIVLSLPEALGRPRTRSSSAALDRKAGRGWTLTERLVGGRAMPVGQEPAVAQASFFLGSDPARWKSGVETYDAVTLGEVWPGVEMRLRAHGGNFEKLFTVRPGADPSRIRMRVGGARKLALDSRGALVVSTGLGPVVFTPPAAYQEIDGAREPVQVAYLVRGREYGFRLGSHDPSLPVVIDPLLQATYLGAAGEDTINDLGIHPTTGEVYVAGFTPSSLFPGTAGGAQATYGGGNQDGFIARLNADLTNLLQATFLGGSAYDQINALAIHPSTGEIYVCGNTLSSNFPGKGGPQPDIAGGQDAFVTRLNPNLTTAPVSTYLGAGGNDFGIALAIHPTSGEVYMAGFAESTTFPFTTGGYQPARANIGSFEAWVVRLNAGLTAAPAPQASWLGGTSFEEIFAIAVTSAGVYVAGITGSTDFPGVATGGQPTIGGGFGDTSAFVSLLNANLTALTRSSYFGGNGLDTAFEVAVHPTSGDVYIAGGTSSTDLGHTVGGAQPVLAGPTDNYVARFNGALSSIPQATYNGGTAAEGADTLTIHPSSGDVYISGITTSTDFPGTAEGAQGQYGGGGGDAFVSRFNADLTALLEPATYLGGSEDDEVLTMRIHPSTGEVYVAGYTISTDLPRTANGAQPLPGGAPSDAFAARLTPDLAGVLVPNALVVDPAPSASSDGNGIFEPGETDAVQPAWKNLSPAGVVFTGSASAFTGPAGATYSLLDSSAAYGTIGAGQARDCSATPDCFSMFVSAPAARPVAHWDTTFTETPSSTDPAKVWTLHLGDSFTDVPRSYPFYRRIETVFHNGITVGCTANQYCPTDKVSRSQMAIFIARGIARGAGNVPAKGKVNGVEYNCVSFGTSLFSDVAPTDTFCRGVHYLASLNVTTGCGPSLYCTAPNVTRAEMAIFVARGIVAPGGGAAVPQTYGPDPVTSLSYSCNPASPNLHFTDIALSDSYCKHTHFLWAKGVIEGCGGTLYCPTRDIGRDEMAKFLANAFQLPLYGP